jgi:hypothetical protein
MREKSDLSPSPTAFHVLANLTVLPCSTRCEPLCGLRYDCALPCRADPPHISNYALISCVEVLGKEIVTATPSPL